VQIIELQNGVAVSTNYFLWCGTELCEQRDLTGGTVIKRFLKGGEQISGSNYYFTKDHLGSVREMTDGSGTIQARYDYDPYGRRTKTFGSLDADFGFSGYFYHSVSGLSLTLFRAYDSNLGRWLSMDPLHENAGFNLYAYAENDPINNTDPLGLLCTNAVQVAKQVYDKASQVYDMASKAIDFENNRNGLISFFNNMQSNQIAADNAATNLDGQMSLWDPTRGYVDYANTVKAGLNYIAKPAYTVVPFVAAPFNAYDKYSAVNNMINKFRNSSTPNNNNNWHYDGPNSLAQFQMKEVKYHLEILPNGTQTRNCSFSVGN
jgi:RHS repeat-associated protein